MPDEKRPGDDQAVSPGAEREGAASHEPRDAVPNAAEPQPAAPLSPMPGTPVFPLAPPGSPGIEAPTPSGTAWGAPRPAFNRIVDTVRAVLLEPRAFFAAMPTTGGFLPPLLFYLLIASVGLVVNVLFQFAFRSFGDRSTIVALPFILVAVVIFAPLMLAVGAFIGAGIYHVMLILLGAATQRFEATFRVLTYGAGSTSVISILPFCGGVIASVWQIIVAIIGLKEVHRTSTGKAAAAVLIPALVCCAAIVAVVASVGVMAVLAAITAAQGRH